MRIGLLHFSTLDAGRELLQAASRALGARTIVISPRASELPPCDAVVVAGALSLGHGHRHLPHHDEPTSDTGAAGSAVVQAIAAFAAAGGPVLGINDGFRILCQAGLLPGSLSAGPPDQAHPVEVHLRVEGRPTPFTSAIPAGRVMRLGATAAHGCYEAADVDALEERGQIIFRYCDTGGGATHAANPRRSLRSIAGVCNPRGNVVALVSHPRAGDDGHQLIQSLRLHLGKVN
jgi:phosphoribosylformylglycinamidine (FGAM) synthase-like amidotransferase family enzyme